MERDHLADAVWLTEHMQRNGYAHAKPLPARPGWYACLSPLLFTTAIIAGEIGDDYTVGDRWCYHSPRLALLALTVWDGTGEPDGWHRHPFSGRRREHGLAELEVVAP